MLMGITFYVSHNSRYFLGLEGREAFLMRENRDIWRTRIPFTNFQIAGVGNLGRVVVRAEEGVFRAEPAPVPKFEEIPIFGSSVLKQENAHLGRVVLNATGDRLMVEKISRKSKLGDKIIKMISSSPVQKGQFIHDLVLYSLESKKRVLVFRSSADRRLPHAF